MERAAALDPEVAREGLLVLAARYDLLLGKPSGISVMAQSWDALVPTTLRGESLADACPSLGWVILALGGASLPSTAT